MEGADLIGAQMEGADLSGAQMEGANLIGAQMEGADLTRGADGGADLRYADLRRSEWAGASSRASPAHSADLRGAQGLTQAQLEELIGNPDTLLPDGPSDTGAPFYVWSCWETPAARLRPVSTPLALAASRPRETAPEFLCGREPRHKTGTPLAVDAPRPPGHPLGEPRLTFHRRAHPTAYALCMRCA